MGAAASLQKKDDSSSDDSDEEGGASSTSILTTAVKGTSLPIFKSPSKRNSTNFTPEELQEIKDIEEMQRKATAFISKHFYYGVPVVIVRQSVDPYSPVFVQPNANLALERVHSHLISTVKKDWDIVKSVPTTVMVNNKGGVVICFEKTGVNYEVSIGNLLDNIANNSDKIIDPEPPVLTARTQTSLTLNWDHLPDPPGLSQYVDVQYSRLLRHKNKPLFHYLDKTNSQIGIYDFDMDLISEEPWSALVSKTWDSSNFTHFCFGDLSPGAPYVFRLRYRNHRGWSEYSEPSRIYRTEPGVPSAPVPPLSDAIMPHAVHLRWAPPPDNNGAAVTGYILEGKAVGDSFAVLFTGMRLSFVVFNLFPHAGYNFQVSAINSIGTSTPSTVYSILTPALLHAPPYQQDWRSGVDFMTDYLESGDGGINDLSQSCYANAQRCRDAWATHYDFQTNQMFYFNVLTGSRQLNMPNALLNPTLPIPSGEEQEELEIKILDEVEIANEKKKAFRTKRFRFIRDVHVNRKKKYKEVVARQQKKPSNITSSSDMSAGAALASAAPFTLPVIRDSLLSDTFKAFSIRRDNGMKTNRGGGANKTIGAYNEEQCDLMGKLTRKLRILFHQEAGIDVGGLSKEFYLLLSEQMIAYMGKSCRNIIRLTESGKLFFNEDFCEETTVPAVPNTKGVGGMASSQADSETTTTTSSAPRQQAVSSSSLLDLIELQVQGGEFCQFFGRLTGKAIYDQHMLTMPLSGVLLAHLIGFTGEGRQGGGEESTPAKRNISKTKPADIVFTEEDLADLDSALFKSLKWIENNNIEGVIDNTFTVASKANKAKVEKEVNLCKNGDQIEVTESNKLDYVKLLEQWKTTFSVNSLLSHFLEGFWDIIPLEVIQDSHITKAELDLIMNGKPVIDVEEIRAYTIFQGEEEFSDNHPQVIQLWQTVREFEEEDKRLFLFFVTGTSRVPLDGYDPPFNITQGLGMEKNSLPRAHTCFNQLVLPYFSSLEVMREKLLFALKETEGFQLS